MRPKISSSEFLRIRTSFGYAPGEGSPDNPSPEEPWQNLPTVRSATIKETSGDLPPPLRIIAELGPHNFDMSLWHIGHLTGHSLESMLFALDHWFGPVGHRAIDLLVCDALDRLEQSGLLSAELIGLTALYVQQVRRGGVDDQHLSIIISRLNTMVTKAIDNRDAVASKALSCCIQLMMLPTTEKFAALVYIASVTAVVGKTDTPEELQKALSDRLREMSMQLLGHYQSLYAPQPCAAAPTDAVPVSPEEGRKMSKDVNVNAANDGYFNRNPWIRVAAFSPFIVYAAINLFRIFSS